jgi:hypothetical protein
MLSLRSERFRTLWARQDVRHKSTGTSLLRHPQVGELELSYEKLLIPATDTQTLVTYHARPGSESEERLRLLASLSTPDRAQARMPHPPSRSTASSRPANRSFTAPHDTGARGEADEHDVDHEA